MASRACHGLHCLGPKDGCYLPHHHIDGDGLASEDIQQILSISIVEEHLPSCSWSESGIEQEPANIDIASDSEGGSTDDSTDENDLSKLRRELGKAKPDGIRHRQLSRLLKNAEIHQRTATRAHREDRLARRH